MNIVDYAITFKSNYFDHIEVKKTYKKSNFNKKIM